MKIFNQLAQLVETKWSAQQNNIESFTDIATSALQSFSYDMSLEQLHAELTEWMLKHEKLPEQINVHNTFGQPPITVFNNGKFVVDIYLWVNFDTSIHSHGFRGAFKVLHGRSLQEDFKVKTLEKVATDIMLVDMSDMQSSLLEAGAVHAIAPGFELTHRVIHLTNPTVTLCVKTINEPKLKQWTYLPTGLSIQKQNVKPDLIKKLYYYAYLIERDEAAAQAYLQSLLDSLDISTQIHVYEDVASGAYDLKALVVEAITEEIVARHENTVWWPLYESAYMAQINELHFTSCNDPIGRMVGHFINSGADLKLIKNILTGISTLALKEAAKDLIDLEAIFNYDLTAEDRAIIKELILNPEIKIPLRLQQFEQIQKMRDFLLSI